MGYLLSKNIIITCIIFTIAVIDISSCCASRKFVLLGIFDLFKVNIDYGDTVVPTAKEAVFPLFPDLPPLTQNIPHKNPRQGEPKQGCMSQGY